MISKVLATLVAVTIALCAKDVFRLCREVYRSHKSPLKNIPGPKPDGLFSGSIAAIIDPNPTTLYEKWVEEHGHVSVFKAILNVCTRSIVCTTKATITH
jgi:hypothetical protein